MDDFYLIIVFIPWIASVLILVCFFVIWCIIKTNIARIRQEQENTINTIETIVMKSEEKIISQFTADESHLLNGQDATPLSNEIANTNKISNSKIPQIYNYLAEIDESDYIEIANDKRYANSERVEFLENSPEISNQTSASASKSGGVEPSTEMNMLLSRNRPKFIK